MKSLINQAGVSRRRFLQVSGAGVVTATAIGSGLITPRAAFAEPYSGTFTWISPRGTIEVMDDYAIWVAQEMGYFGDLGVDVGVCRRLQLLSRMEHHEQDNEQVFPRSA
jgi:NitT/TauT family transport system substrate-binding protein